ncbi:Digalactosyldiacylglycerol synthase 1 [Lathyrus oleraceus]|uniref:Digalactosyldiacylglycerol synthase 1 n=1 Tax=Pisum sativum TaxID=3888 RepID=A0A9D5AP39_PEA|nr:Digalactosyldiacylglycerol synthase 1 [Pisum sativum]
MASTWMYLEVERMLMKFRVQLRRSDLNLNFEKGKDHADDSLHNVCVDHPSNEFFNSFPNCLIYKTPEDFVAKVKEALENEPYPLTPEQRYKLSWEAATQRFMEYSDLDQILNKEKDGVKPSRDKGKLMGKSASMPNLSELANGGFAFAHYCLTGNELLRLCTGAIPGTRDYDKQHCKVLKCR